MLLTSIVIEGAGSERDVDVDVDRIGRLLEELANRGRITRRPTEDDPAIGLHIPGMRLRLIGSEKVAEGPGSQWTVSSYTSLVLKRLLRVAELLERQVPPGLSFLDLADQIWAHIERRRIEAPNGRGLWDEPTQVFTGTPLRPVRRCRPGTTPNASSRRWSPPPTSPSRRQPPPTELMRDRQAAPRRGGAPV